jgi:hypothetical protein
MTDIFESPTTPETTPAQPAVALPDEARELIGEGKKYGSVEAALKALPHAQSHISTLERELKELRETLAKERALSESMTVINGQAPVKPATPVFDESVISSVIDRKLQETAEKRLSDANVAASEVWKAKATEIGVSTDFLTQLISKSATAGKELFGLKNDTKPIPPTSGAKVNTTVLNNSQPTQPVKPVMGGVKTADLVNAWRAAQAQVMDKYK